MNVDPSKLSWNVVGWAGQTVFFSRFLVQWYATEKKKQVVVPDSFWWLSLVGCLLLLVFSVFYLKSPVIICGYAISWIPYVRNLIIHHRHKEAHLDCPHCKRSCPPDAKFCSECGTALAPQNAPASA
jgi:lipid-A-disaccharide synthase-like uncharacterized protein